MEKIKIKSSYMTSFGRLEGDIGAITLEALRGVLRDTDNRRVRHIFVAAYAPADLCQIPDPMEWTKDLVRHGFPEIRAEFHGVYRTGGEALYTALEHASADPKNCDGTLVVGFEKMTHRPPAETAGILSERENPHDRAYGATLPALGALVTRAYQQSYGVPESAWHRVAVKNHGNAVRNPKAQFRRAVTIDDVMTSPLVSDPLRRLHCAPTSDGAAAVLLDSRVGDTW
ncbi:MAG: hypothetical protein JSW50_02830, partial [Candidatus Latescibacterota bacterium]